MDHYAPNTNHGDSDFVKALRSDHVDKSLPKNFERPLTCFFWHQTGRCNKRDIDCAYAHYNTGHYAAGPIHVACSAGTVAVAGKNARILNAPTAVLQSQPSIAELHRQAARLGAWEQELTRREAFVKMKEQQLDRAMNGETRWRERHGARWDRGLRRRGGHSRLDPPKTDEME